MQLKSLKDMAEPNEIMADKIEIISNDLYRRITEETERILMSQLQLLGVNTDDDEIVLEKFKKMVYPHYDRALASYEYDGKKILGIRISDNDMAIEFDIVDLTKESQGGSE